jgi:hypothetical protein
MEKEEYASVQGPELGAVPRLNWTHQDFKGSQRGESFFPTLRQSHLNIFWLREQNVEEFDVSHAISKSSNSIVALGYGNAELLFVH